MKKVLHSGAGSEGSERSMGCELFSMMTPHTAFRDPPDLGGGQACACAQGGLWAPPCALLLGEERRVSPGLLAGGGFEWDDDFSPDPFLSRTTSHLLSSKPALQTSKYFSPPPPRSAEPSWPHAAPYSRFSITPASIASFSLTHLTDSDMEQGGEEAEVLGRGRG